MGFQFHLWQIWSVLFINVFLKTHHFFFQIPQWEGDNQLCRIHGFTTALFSKRHSSCPTPLQSLLLTQSCMTSPAPQLPATTSLEQMPPLPGPVTSITAPFYDASFRCQVCLPVDYGWWGLPSECNWISEAQAYFTFRMRVHLDWVPGTIAVG